MHKMTSFLVSSKCLITSSNIKISISISQWTTLNSRTPLKTLTHPRTSTNILPPINMKNRSRRTLLWRWEMAATTILCSKWCRRGCSTLRRRGLRLNGKGKNKSSKGLNSNSHNMPIKRPNSTNKILIKTSKTISRINSNGTTHSNSSRIIITINQLTINTHKDTIIPINSSSTSKIIRSLFKRNQIIMVENWLTMLMPWVDQEQIPINQKRLLTWRSRWKISSDKTQKWLPAIRCLNLGLILLNNSLSKLKLSLTLTSQTIRCSKCNYKISNLRCKLITWETTMIGRWKWKITIWASKTRRSPL